MSPNLVPSLPQGKERREIENGNDARNDHHSSLGAALEHIVVPKVVHVLPTFFNPLPSLVMQEVRVVSRARAYLFNALRLDDPFRGSFSRFGTGRA